MMTLEDDNGCSRRMVFDFLSTKLTLVSLKHDSSYRLLRYGCRPDYFVIYKWLCFRNRFEGQGPLCSSGRERQRSASSS